MNPSTYFIKKIISLIKIYSDNDEKRVQLNIVGNAPVDEKQPKKHRDLTVRITDYNAYFVTLTKAMQEDMISRTSLDMK